MEFYIYWSFSYNFLGNRLSSVFNHACMHVIFQYTLLAKFVLLQYNANANLEETLHLSLAFSNGLLVWIMFL